MDKIRLLPPRLGTCPLCGARHAKSEAHEWQSAYFMMRFFRRHRRLPTKEDAEKMRNSEFGIRN